MPPLLPVSVQEVFDLAKRLQRGRIGKDLSQFVAPDLEAAEAAFCRGFDLLELSLAGSGDGEGEGVSAAAPMQTDPQVVRVVESYRTQLRQLQELRKRISERERAKLPFDETLRASQIFCFDTDRYPLAQLVAAVAEVATVLPADSEREPAESKADAKQQGLERRIDEETVAQSEEESKDLDMRQEEEQVSQVKAAGNCSSTFDLSDTSATLAIAASRSLANLHRWHPQSDSPPPQCPALVAAWKSAGRKLPKAWAILAGRRKEHIKAFKRTNVYSEFVEVYAKFVEEVIVPLVKEPVIFQCPPTLRFQFPSLRPSIARHKDSSYPGHLEEAEINFWVPITKVFGAASLWVESMPGKGDFAALEMDYGQFYRFNGQHCEHFTVPNTTSCTRVSLDFRVVPFSQWSNKFGGRIGTYPARASPGAVVDV